MFNKGDQVRVISATKEDDILKEYVPIGTICTITQVCFDENEFYYGIKTPNGETWYYLENELELEDGEWINPTWKVSDTEWTCSKCGANQFLGTYRNFCPNCGKKMKSNINCESQDINAEN